MSKVLYIDAPAGLSGDMLGGAMLDMGLPLERVRQMVAVMGLEGVTVDHLHEQKQQLAASRLQVEISGHQPHRHMRHIYEIVDKLPGPVAQRARQIFERMGQAEAAVHGSTIEEVHLHEVGMSDALTDVATFCAGLEHFEVERIICSPLPLGRGFVDCAHGRLPLPAPAVVELLKGASVTGWPEEGETVTPTGAACVAALAESFGPPPDMELVASGAGCGSRTWQHAPNLVRLLLGKQQGRHGHGDVTEIACHLDDMNPEDVPMVIERFMAAGALDAAAAPILMKKGRPGFLLTVMAHPHQAREMADLILQQTTSLGVRLRTWGRQTLHREIITVPSPWGPVRVKRAKAGGAWRFHPEADDVARVCRDTGLAPHDVRAQLARLAADQTNSTT